MTPSKKSTSKPLTTNQIVSAVKDMLLESIREISSDIFKHIRIQFDKLDKKLDVLNEGTDNVLHRQQEIMDKLRDHERRIKELENGYLKN
jgi:hypothetical protein